MPVLTLDRLEKKFGNHVAASNVTLTVQDGEFVSLLGPSGCGKTTVLRMVAGLVTPTSGRILVDDTDITNLPTNRRNIGLVFQSYALFPHMTVFENVAFGLRRQGVKGADLQARVNAALASVRLTQYGDRYPRQLSGGQQQRVAVARSVAPQPSVLLFDEPLSNLDAALRDEMQFELKRLQRELGMTTLFVTHDQSEAMSMSDRVCVLADGVVQQYATPEDIYHRPATAFVAGFIGRSNRLAGVVEMLDGNTCSVRLPSGQVFRSDRGAPPRRGETVDIVVRQEDLFLALTPREHAHAGKVVMRSFVGSRVQYVVGLEGGLEVIAEVATNGEHAGLESGAQVFIGVQPGHVYVNRAPASMA
ncbi:ABC transporter ATP-binding protein [Alcaligenaceae bacterium]|nr:ABC transporter ATP-binding protein [Alcaligenaceae bacterium]